MGNLFTTKLSENHFHEITPNLFIGDRYSIYDKFFVDKKKLIIVNATNDILFNKKINSVNIRLSVNDDLSLFSNQTMYDNLHKLTDIIHKYLNNDFIVLVHCVAGRQRSCAIVAAYLMKHNKIQRKQAIEFIKTKRPYAFFMGVNFSWALKKFSQTLK